MKTAGTSFRSAAYVGVIALIFSVTSHHMSSLYLIAGILIIIVAILATYLIRKTIRTIDQVKDSLYGCFILQ